MDKSGHFYTKLQVVNYIYCGEALEGYNLFKFIINIYNTDMNEQDLLDEGDYGSEADLYG